MYGRFVHEAVVEAKETRPASPYIMSTNVYDHGQVIFQERVPVTPEDTPGTVAQKVHQLEQSAFPKIIEACGRSQRPS